MSYKFRLPWTKNPKTKITIKQFYDTDFASCFDWGSQ